MGYHELMRTVFPQSEYPRAYEYSANGGPPGCAMALGKAIRSLRCFDFGGRGTDEPRTIRLPEELMRPMPPAIRARCKQLRIDGKQGRSISEEDSNFLMDCISRWPQEYREIGKEAFEQTKPFGSLPPNANSLPESAE